MKNLASVKMNIFTDIKICLAAIGLIDTHFEYNQSIRILLAALTICMHIVALLTTTWFMVFYAYSFEQYAETLPMINAFVFTLAEFCLLLLRRNKMLAMLQELQTIIEKRKFIFRCSV